MYTITMSIETKGFGFCKSIIKISCIHTACTLKQLFLHFYMNLSSALFFKESAILPS